MNTAEVVQVNEKVVSNEHSKEKECEVIEITSDDDDEVEEIRATMPKTLSNEQPMNQSPTIITLDESDASEHDNPLDENDYPNNEDDSCSESGESGYKECWCFKCERGLDEIEALVNTQRKGKFKHSISLFLN